MHNILPNLNNIKRLSITAKAFQMQYGNNLKNDL